MPTVPPEPGLAVIWTSPLRHFRELIRRSLLLPSPGQGSVDFWRQRLMELLLPAGAVLGLLVYVPSALLAARVHLWGVLVADTLAYGWVATAALSPRWSHKSRAWGILVVFYLLALVLLTKVGTAGAGMLWIAAIPVLAALLLGLRAAAAAWGLALATLAAGGWALSAGYILAFAGPAIFNLDVAAWWVYSANALFLSAVLALATAALLRGLEHTHRALSREEERFAKVFHLSPEPICILGMADERFEDVNGAWSAAFGWSRDEVLGKSTGELGLWRFEADRRKLWTGPGETTPQAVDLRRKDGTWVPVLLSARMMELGDGACLLVMARDLTALKQAERERSRFNERLNRVQALEALGVLVAGVAHNINNVLAVILGTASLREHLSAKASDITDFRIIGTACRRGREVLKSLLHFAQPSLSARAPFELHALIGEVCQLMGNTTRNRITVEPVLLAEPLWVMGDASSINHALMNLSLNAMDAMPDGGTLRVRTAIPAAEWLEVSVEDTGTGMAPEVLDRVLEPFFTTKGVGKGTGLGLSMTYGVVKAHGGTLEIASQPGQGTQVKLRLPRIPAPCAPAAPAPGPGPGLRPGKVLLVDDDEDVRFLMTRMLTKSGVAQVTSVAGGEEALASLGSGDLPGLVILDQNMPGMDGLQTLARIRSLHPDLPVLISSGQPDIEDWPAFQQPRVGVIPKPFDMDEIEAKLALLLQEQRRPA
jgi:PAS domain S-box-containing protein